MPCDNRQSPTGKRRASSSLLARTPSERLSELSANEKLRALCLLQPSQLPFPLYERVLLSIFAGDLRMAHYGEELKSNTLLILRNNWQSNCFRSTEIILILIIYTYKKFLILENIPSSIRWEELEGGSRE